MELGNIVEYIDRQKFICAVILEVKKYRLRLLTETNREVNLSSNRIIHYSETVLNPALGRDKLVEILKKKVSERQKLAGQVDVQELWEVLHSEQVWIDFETMTGLTFPDDSNENYQSAVIRAFFADKLYFKFKPEGIHPNTKEQVERLQHQIDEDNRRKHVIEQGSIWLKNIHNRTQEGFECPLTEKDDFIDILKSIYLFGKESPYFEMGNEILKKSGIETPDALFQALVKLGVWDANENIDIYKFDVPVDFSNNVESHTADLVDSPPLLSAAHNRIDLTDLPLFTIDGQSTLDYDDALSIEKTDNHYRLGVHIADVGYFVKKEDVIDKEAMQRGSSIYMPDGKIPMLPYRLAEDLCSLKAGQVRPTISIMIQLDSECNILGYEIFPSLVRVKHQLTYYDVNMMLQEIPEIRMLYDIADKFHHKRLESGAIQITLPEVNIWVEEDGEIIVTKTNKESPGRMLVSEIMIMANWVMANFLSKEGVPAIFRSQPLPKERLYKGNGGTLFQNWMQRKLVSRFVLGVTPERHTGLGLDSYLTATSPIRKYFDLITQRQIRAILGLEKPYTSDEIEQMIGFLDKPMSYVSKIQFRRKRYWLFKFLESRIGNKEEAIVLDRRKNSYLTLIPEYMLECNLPMTSGISLKPEDLVRITIQHVNARKDLLSVYIG